MRTLPIADFAVAAIPPGTKERLWLEVLPLLNGTVTLPTLVAKGLKPGPTFLAVAGVHGDEYEGMEALRLSFDELETSRMAGTFVAVPVANPFAYEARARVAPLHVDGLNLARVFPGDPNGSPSRILAHHLLQFVLANLTADDLFLDFHSGSADVTYASLVGFRDTPGPALARSEEAARHFGLPRLWRIPDGPGPFNAETARRGITTIGTETTGRAGCLPAEVAAYRRGVHNLLAYLGIVPDPPLSPRNDGPARTSIDVLSPATGFLRDARELDQEVEEGEPLGTVITVFGDAVAEVVSPVAGTIWAARTMPAVRVGELVYTIAVR